MPYHVNVAADKDDHFAVGPELGSAQLSKSMRCRSSRNTLCCRRALEAFLLNALLSTMPSKRPMAPDSRISPVAICPEKNECVFRMILTMIIYDARSYCLLSTSRD